MLKAPLLLPLHRASPQDPQYPRDPPGSCGAAPCDCMLILLLPSPSHTCLPPGDPTYFFFVPWGKAAFPLQAAESPINKNPAREG